MSPDPITSSMSEAFGDLTLDERIAEILDEDAPNKHVWKTFFTLDEWLREKVLPVLRELRALRHKGEGLDEKAVEAAALVLHGQQEYAYDFDREKAAFVRQAGEIVTAYLAATPLQKAQTTCACCGERKPCPLRRDDMGGYVCLSCIEKRLDAPQTPVPEASGVRVRRMHTALRSLSMAARDVLGTLKPGQSLAPAGAALTNRLDSICSEIEASLAAAPLEPASPQPAREAEPTAKLAWAMQAADSHLKRTTMDYDSRDEIISILLTEVRRAALRENP